MSKRKNKVFAVTGGIAMSTMALTTPATSFAAEETTEKVEVVTSNSALGEKATNFYNAEINKNIVLGNSVAQDGSVELSIPAVDGQEKPNFFVATLQKVDGKFVIVDEIEIDTLDYQAKVAEGTYKFVVAPLNGADPDLTKVAEVEFTYAKAVTDDGKDTDKDKDVEADKDKDAEADKDKDAEANKDKDAVTEKAEITEANIVAIKDLAQDYAKEAASHASVTKAKQDFAASLLANKTLNTKVTTYVEKVLLPYAEAEKAKVANGTDAEKTAKETEMANYIKTEAAQFILGTAEFNAEKQAYIKALNSLADVLKPTIAAPAGEDLLEIVDKSLITEATKTFDDAFKLNLKEQLDKLAAAEVDVSPVYNQIIAAVIGETKEEVKATELNAEQKLALDALAKTFAKAYVEKAEIKAVFDKLTTSALGDEAVLKNLKFYVDKDVQPYADAESEKIAANTDLSKLEEAVNALEKEVLTRVKAILTSDDVYKAYQATFVVELTQAENAVKATTDATVATEVTKLVGSDLTVLGQGEFNKAFATYLQAEYASLLDKNADALLAKVSSPNSSTDEPNTGEPNTDEPNTDEPNTGEPNTDEPNTGEPNTGEPNTGEPNTDEPNTDEPNTDDNASDKTPIDESNTNDGNDDVFDLDKPSYEEGSNTGGSSTGGSNTGGSNTGEDSSLDEFEEVSKDNDEGEFDYDSEADAKEASIPKTGDGSLQKTATPLAVALMGLLAAFVLMPKRITSKLGFRKAK